MTIVGIIGGSGLEDMKGLNVTHQESVTGPFGSPSCPVVFGNTQGNEVAFIPRHGVGHTIAPHDINYRANIWALHHFGVSNIIAINTVGGITHAMQPVKLVFPHQIIDYTHSRKHTFFDKSTDELRHVDFTNPYSQKLRELMIQAADTLNIDHEPHAVYGATQGPRLESTAEINRMERDGCDIVGMTGMPEASLSRELELAYACCSVVVNRAAGKNNDELISLDEINRNLVSGMDGVFRMLDRALPAIFKLQE